MARNSQLEPSLIPHRSGKRKRLLASVCSVVQRERIFIQLNIVWMIGIDLLAH